MINVLMHPHHFGLRLVETLKCQWMKHEEKNVFKKFMMMLACGWLQRSHTSITPILKNLLQIQLTSLTVHVFYNSILTTSTKLLKYQSTIRLVIMKLMLVLQILITMLKKILTIITLDAHSWMQILLDRARINSSFSKLVKQTVITIEQWIVLFIFSPKEIQVIWLTFGVILMDSNIQDTAILHSQESSMKD